MKIQKYLYISSLALILGSTVSSYADIFFIDKSEPSVHYTLQDFEMMEASDKRQLVMCVTHREGFVMQELGKEPIRIPGEIETVVLKDCFLRDLSFQNPLSIKQLLIDSCRFDPWCLSETIKGLVNLKELHLTERNEKRVDGIKIIPETLVNLKTLKLKQCFFLEELPNTLTNLEHLSIEMSRKIVSIPTAYTHLKTLELISTGCSEGIPEAESIIIKDCDPKFPKKDLNVVRLSLNNTATKVSTDQLAKLKELSLRKSTVEIVPVQTVEIVPGQIVEIVPVQLLELEKLSLDRVRSNFLEQCNNFLERCRGLKELALINNQIESITVGRHYALRVGRHYALRKLHMSGNNVLGEIIVDLGQCGLELIDNVGDVRFIHESSNQEETFLTVRKIERLVKNLSNIQLLDGFCLRNIRPAILDHVIPEGLTALQKMALCLKEKNENRKRHGQSALRIELRGAMKNEQFKHVCKALFQGDMPVSMISENVDIVDCQETEESIRNFLKDLCMTFNKHQDETKKNPFQPIHFDEKSGVLQNAHSVDATLELNFQLPKKWDFLLNSVGVEQKEVEKPISPFSSTKSNSKEAE